jgi:hypothetical protein
VTFFIGVSPRKKVLGLARLSTRAQNSVKQRRRRLSRFSG